MTEEPGEVPPEVHRTVYSRDLLGRKVPRRLIFSSFLQTIPGFKQRFSPIPDLAWTLDADGEGFAVARVACPCGQVPAVRVGQCERCDCERYFYFTGGGVWVANSPVRTPRAEPVSPDEAGTLAELEP